MNFKLCVAVLLITIMAHISGMNTNKAIDLSGINYAVELQDYRYEICLKKGDKNIGKAVFLLSKGKKTATLWYLEINSELRNKGLGSHLFKAATNLLHCMEIQKVHVMVMPLDLDGMDDADIEKNNKALQKFYEKLGCKVSFQRGYLEPGFAEINPSRYANYLRMLPKKIKRTHPRSIKSLYPQQVAALLRS